MTVRARAALIVVGALLVVGAFVAALTGVFSGTTPSAPVRTPAADPGTGQTTTSAAQPATSGPAASDPGAADTGDGSSDSGSSSGSATKQAVTKPASYLLLNGRRLTPAGTQVALGNFPTGGAVTDDGRFLWTVSTGFASNDIRIVDVATARVIQTITVPGASGGITLDSVRHRAYVSGLTYSRWMPSLIGTLGWTGNCVLVYGWSADTGQAHLLRSIAVRPPADAPPVQAFTPTRANESTATNSWPQKLAVSPAGDRLLVPLNLADHAAIVDLNASDTVRYVATGAYPFAAAVLPGSRIGLVGNEASGTVSVIDLQTGEKLRDIVVGPPLSHPQGIVVDHAGTRAYVALSTLDQVVVIDLADWAVERTISVGRSAGLGTMPVSLAISPDDSRLFVAESGSDSLAAIYLPGPRTKRALEWTLVGHLPTAEDPQVVLTTAAQSARPARLIYVSARGVGLGPNPTGPDPVDPFDPIFWAFNRIAPTTDVFDGSVTYTAAMVRGRAGLMTLPTDAEIAALTPTALAQIRPVGAQTAPVGTPLRAGGPIKHVFFIVRENRSYDQLLGDVSRGNGSRQLTVFGQNVTPNLHSLVTRFPLLDNVLANSEASIQGHFWTAGASVPDYVDRNWVHQYAGRGRPNDFGMLAVSWPGNGFLFDQAERQGISYFNYGEGIAGADEDIPDRNVSPAQRAQETLVGLNSDLGPLLTPGGTYACDLSIGQALDGDPRNPASREIFDSSLPAGAPAGALSHVDSFRARFSGQLASGQVPTFNYITLTSDHTRGTQPGFPTPTAMVADSDLALGEMVETISHSDIWSSSVIFVVEDDCQDGADHVDAHRIPVAVISPYARRGAVIHSRYDLLSVVRSMELIMGMQPLSLNDALASPMYDAFTSSPLNSTPVDAIPANVDLLERNTTGAPWATLSASLPFGELDAVPQAQLDAILWKSVFGADSTPPPAGPNAVRE